MRISSSGGAARSKVRRGFPPTIFWTSLSDSSLSAPLHPPTRCVLAIRRLYIFSDKYHGLGLYPRLCLDVKSIRANPVSDHAAFQQLLHKVLEQTPSPKKRSSCLPCVCPPLSSPGRRRSGSYSDTDLLAASGDGSKKTSGGAGGQGPSGSHAVRETADFGRHFAVEDFFNHELAICMKAKSGASAPKVGKSGTTGTSFLDLYYRPTVAEERAGTSGPSIAFGGGDSSVEGSRGLKVVGSSSDLRKQITSRRPSYLSRPRRAPGGASADGAATPAPDGSWALREPRQELLVVLAETPNLMNKWLGVLTDE